MHRTLVPVLFLALPMSAAAAAPFDADAHTSAVAPFVQDETVAVAHVDLTRIDFDGLTAKLAQVGNLKDDDVAWLKREIGERVARLAGAGAKDVYFVLGLADLPVGPPLAVVPLPEGVKGEAVEAALRQTGVFRASKTVGRAVVAGTEQALRRLGDGKPVRRPEAAQAFAAAGDGAVQLLLLPPTDLRRAFEEVFPRLPREFGGGPVQAVTRGVRWAALGLDLTPTPALRLVVQAPDAAAAKELDRLVQKLFQVLAVLKEVRQALPNFDAIAELLAPAVEKDRLKVTLDEKGLTAVLGPVVTGLRGSATRSLIANNLRELAIAMYHYVDAHKGLFPAVANFDKQGKPLLSWRVHLLPFLEEEKLYKEFRLDEPWDSEHNKKLIPRMPRVYQGPNRKLNEAGKTIYLVPVGEKVAFTGGPQRRQFPRDFQDGTSQTILHVEADDERAVTWTKPEDLKIDLDQPHRGLGGHLDEGFLVALADGSTRVIPKTISKETLRAAFTVAASDLLGPDW